MIFLPKSQPAPSCLEEEKLKKSGKYNCEDVISRLEVDFKNKCYLCEEKEISNINIEHFIPHKGNIDLKFNWNNLFLSCSHCNNTKSDKYNNILNCTIKEDEVETKISYSYIINNDTLKITALIKALEENDRVTNTTKLLDEIYNGKTPTKKLESANLKKKLIKELHIFNELLKEFYAIDKNSKDREILMNDIKRKLEDDSSFTAFKRWVIRDNEIFREPFGSLI